jgi:hypothetical protein
MYVAPRYERSVMIEAVVSAPHVSLTPLDICHTLSCRQCKLVVMKSAHSSVELLAGQRRRGSSAEKKLMKEGSHAKSNRSFPILGRCSDHRDAPSRFA